MAGCGPNAIKTACAMSYRDPFVMPVNEQQKVRSKIMKKKLATELPSDQLAIVRAILQYNQVTTQQNYRGVQKFCDDHFLSRNTMSYLQSLCQSVSQNVQMATGINPNSSVSSRNNADFLLLNAMVGFGLYSNFAIRKMSSSMFTTEKGRKAKVHPSSLNNTNAKNSISAFNSSCNQQLEAVGFQDLVSLSPQKGRDAHIGGASVQMLSTSPMSVFVLLLACGSFDQQVPSTSSVSTIEEFVLSPSDKASGLVIGVVDHWLPIRIYEETFRMISDVRECLNDSISSFLLHHHRNRKVSSTETASIPGHVSSFINALAKVFSIEHASKVSPPPPSLDVTSTDQKDAGDGNKGGGGRGGKRRSRRGGK